MAIGFVIFEGNDAYIEGVENLITQINAIYKLNEPESHSSDGRERCLREYLNDTSEENKELSIFLLLVDKYLDIDDEINGLRVLAEQTLIFNHSNNSVDFEGDMYDVFQTDAWANLLANAFPCLSFFIVGDMTYLDDNNYGYEWRIYKEGTCEASEDHIYCIEDLIENEEEDREKLIICINEILQKNILTWSLRCEDEKQLKIAEVEEKLAREKLEKMLNKLGI
jgi:hypothetical protein